MRRSSSTPPIPRLAGPKATSSASVVQSFEVFLNAGITQGVPMGREGIGNDNFGACANVILVNPAQNIRIAQRTAAIPSIVELWDTAAFDLCSCRAVDQDLAASG